MSLIAARDLCKTYKSSSGAVQALAGVSFDIEPGEFVAVMGASGSGKSTLMNLLGLLDRPTSGGLTIEGEDVSNADADRQARIRSERIGFIFQSYNLLPRSTAIENVELPLVYSGVPKAARRARAEELLSKVGLGDRQNHWSSALSGGEQQRVAIARAMIGNPALILADEPTGALDTRTGEAVLEILQTLNDAGTTLILVTHDEAVACYARRVMRLTDGHLLEDAPVTHRKIAGADPCP